MPAFDFVFVQMENILKAFGKQWCHDNHVISLNYEFS